MPFASNLEMMSSLMRCNPLELTKKMIYAFDHYNDSSNGAQHLFGSFEVLTHRIQNCLCGI